MAQKTMSPSPSVTNKQIENVLAKIRVAITNHRSEFPRAAVQAVLGAENIGMKLTEPFLEHTKAAQKNLLRIAKAKEPMRIIHLKGIDRSVPFDELLDATKCWLGVWENGESGELLSTSRVYRYPSGEGNKVDLCFFELDTYMRGDELAKEYELRGLKPDPCALAVANQRDHSLAQEFGQRCQWKDSSGNWHMIEFGCYDHPSYKPHERHRRLTINGNGGNMMMGIGMKTYYVGVPK